MGIGLCGEVSSGMNLGLPVQPSLSEDQINTK